jgi:hypothetical protein
LIDVTGKTQEVINTAVEAAIVGLEPVKVTLVTDVLGQTGYDAVRIQPVKPEKTSSFGLKIRAILVRHQRQVGWGPL